MKIVRYLLLCCCLLTYGVWMTSCGSEATEQHDHSHGEGHDHDHDHSHEDGHDHDHTEANVDKPHGPSAEYTSAYVCPMHCKGSGSDEPGLCPVCEMDYVAQVDHVKDKHEHKPN